MHYIFVVNGRSDRSYVLPDLEKQLAELDLDYEIYVTAAVGDATRFVNIHCDLNPEPEECFVACGGSGTTNEVASGLVGKKGKYLAILSYGGTNDILKSLPERDYKSVAALVGGESIALDILKVNDSYALNVADIGFDAAVALKAEEYYLRGRADAYKKSLSYAVLHARFHKVRLAIDGDKPRKRYLLLGTFANGKYCGGEFMCAPRAKYDDGLMEVCIIRPMTMLEFLLILPKYRLGKHLDDKFCRRRMFYCQARDLWIYGDKVMNICIDGEVISLPEFHIRVLPKSINLILPTR